MYQAFSSEIDISRDDVLSRINASDSKISEVLYVGSIFARYENGSKKVTYDGEFPQSMSQGESQSETQTDQF